MNEFVASRRGRFATRSFRYIVKYENAIILKLSSGENLS